MTHRIKGGGGAGAGPSPTRRHGAAPYDTEKEAVQRHPAARGAGRARKAGFPPPDRLLITFAGGLGDLVMTLPLLSRAARQCREVWLCALEGYDKWLGLVDVKGLRIVGEREFKSCNAPRFDAAIMTHSTPGGPPLPSNRLPDRLGIAGRNYPFPCHATDANLEAGAMVGLREDYLREYPLLVPDGPPSATDGAAIICPGNSARGEWRKKLLPHRTWPAVVDLLRADMEVFGVDLYPPIVKLDLDRSWWGTLKPPGLAALLSGAGVVVTVDCGVAHLAGALGTPVAVAWGPTSRAWSRPIGPAVSFVSKTRSCRECLGTPFWNECRAPTCMDISPEAVTEAARKALTMKGAAIHA